MKSGQHWVVKKVVIWSLGCLLVIMIPNFLAAQAGQDPVHSRNSDPSEDILAIKFVDITVRSCLGFISIGVTDGVAPYVFEWTDQDGNPVPSDDQSDGSESKIENLTPGTTYFVTVTDANGLTASDDWFISNPKDLIISVDITDVTCRGGSNGIVEAEVTNGSAPIKFQLFDTSNNLLETGSTGTKEFEIDRLSAGDYVIMVTDIFGCEGQLNITISEPATSVGANLINLQNPLCFGDTTGFITVEGTGGTVTSTGYTYEWFDGVIRDEDKISDSTTLINVGAGTYTLRVLDRFGCPYTEDFTLTDPAQLIATDTTIVAASCFGFNDGSIDVTVVGGTGTLDYSWSNGAVTEDLTNIAAGSYTLTVTDDNGCTLVETYMVDQPTAINPVENITHISCRGETTGAITVTVSGGSGNYDFSWSDGPTTQDRSDLSAGSYTLTVTDDSGCFVSETYNITEPADGLSIDSFTDNTPICFGGADGSLGVNVSGGTTPYTYQWWFNGNPFGQTTQTITNLSAGNYEVLVTDANGCTIMQDFDLADPTALTANPTFVLPSCNGDTDGSITVAASNGVGPYTYSWSTGDVGPAVNNLGAGSYTVTITDNIGCQIDEVIVLTEPDPLDDNATETNVSCNGFDDGSVVLNVVGGTAPYTYTWSTGGSGSSINNLAPGNYSVTIVDTNGCTIDRDYTITEPDLLVLTSTKTDVLCFGEATGAINVTVAGGTAPYTYSWTNGASTEDLSNITAGSYTLTVTDANGCVESEMVTIDQPSSGITVVESVTDLSCSGDPTGIISLNVSGGTAPYSYLWSDGETTQDRSGLSQGTYTVTITDANNCQEIRNIIIGQPQGITIDSIVQNITCYDDDDGAIDVTVSGGTAPYTYDWGGGITTEDRQNLSPGSYALIVTDANGCQSNAQITITEPDELIATNTHTNILCFGEATGAIDLSVTGGTMPYSYSWTNGATTEDLSGLMAGIYTVTVTDANGCSTILPVTLTEPAAALQVDGAVSNESCSGFSNAGVVLTVTGGTEPYSYSWSNGSMDKDITSVLPGNYQVTVTDANGCTVMENYTITGPQPLDISADVTNLVCFEQADGSIDLTISGGTGPFTFDWSNGETTEDITGLLAGTYQVIVTDANGCSTNDSFTLTQPPALIVNSTIQGVSCFGEVDGGIDLGVTGGVTPYTYSWSNGTTTQDLSALVGGAYTVTVTDANGCVVIETYTVPAPTGPLAATGLVTDVACHGEQTGGVVLTVTGGTEPYTYSWSNGSTFRDLTNVFPGNYSVDITDANGCTFSSNFDISESTPITATLTPTDPTCFGDANGSILLDVSGGVAPYTFFWSNGGTSQNQFNLISGPYVVTIRDANNCTLTRNITLGGNRGLDINVNRTDVTCRGEATGAISLDVFGGTGNYTFSWNTGATTRSISGLTAGVYECVVTDDDGCDNSVTVIIAEPAQVLSARVDFTNLLVCFQGTDGVATVTPQGGTAPYSYLWSNGERSQNISNLTAGNYSIIVTDANGCTFQQTFDIAEPDSPIAVVPSGKLMLDCNGDSDGNIITAISGGQGPYQVLWSNGLATPNISDLTAGDYIVRVTDSRGCVHEEIITVSEPDPISLAEFTINDTQCYNDRTGSIELTVQGGTAPYSYAWSNGTTSRNLTAVGTGNYSVVITDANGCEFRQNFALDNAPLFILQPDVALISCYNAADASIALNITGGTAPFSISWSNGEDDEIISGLGPGTYTAKVVDANGCELEQSFDITNPFPLTADRIIENANGCDNPESGSITVIASGGRAPYTYDWSNGMTTPVISNIPPGVYTVIVTDSFGCTFMDSYPVTRVEPIVVNLFPEEVIDCETQEAYVVVNAQAEGGFGGYSYTWSRGSSTADTVQITDPGRLVLVVTDDRGCQRTEEIDIDIPEFAQADFSFTARSLVENGVIAVNDTVFFTDQSGAATEWFWDFGDDFTAILQDPFHVYTGDSTYQVRLEVLDGAGCNTEITRPVVVDKGYELLVPTAFTPNHDGRNDTFWPKFRGFIQIQFTIYNRWGQPLFATEDIDRPIWDGTFNGENMPNGNYYYRFTGTTLTGQGVSREGAFTLIK